MTIYVPCPDSDRPVGGIKVIYRYVDLLNELGFSAYVLHQIPEFRVTWFSNSTPVAYIDIGKFSRLIRTPKWERWRHYWARKTWGGPGVALDSLELRLIAAPSKIIRPDDYMFVPAVIADTFVRLAKGTKKLIFNQNAYTVTFKQHTLYSPPQHIAYNNADLLGVVVVSQDNKDYLEYVYPNLKTFRHHWSINTERFPYPNDKQRKIAYMPRKNATHALQVINILRARNNLADFEFVPIDGMSENQVAKVLGDSMIFLSFGYPEGCPLPPAEAMASGCIVVGYHGMGGREYFKEEFSYPIPFGDIIQFARTTESVAEMCITKPLEMLRKGKDASRFIGDRYSAAQEKKDIADLWEPLITRKRRQYDAVT